MKPADCRTIALLLFMIGTLARRFLATAFLARPLPPTKPHLSFFFSTASEEESWRSHPDLNPSVTFPTILVPTPVIQSILRAPPLQPFLASHATVLQNLQQRFKIVRDADDGALHLETRPTGDQENHKLVLLHPDYCDAPLPGEIQALLAQVGAQLGPPATIDFTQDQFTAKYKLDRLLPEAVHPPPTSFETIGHVAHFNLREAHRAYQHVIGQVVLDSLPSISTVIAKTGDVAGPFRTYDFVVVAGENRTQVALVESGVRLEFNVRDVYWCSRLSEERQRLIRDEFRPGQVIADAFCGVGAICLQAAQAKKCRILANDWNPDAIESLRSNAKKNGLWQHFERVACGDAYDFLMDLGLAAKDGCLPDHVLLNYPLESPRFLGALRWWPTKKNKHGIQPRVHVYTFARADEDRTAEDVAVDLIADNLLPNQQVVTKRRQELNDFGCQVDVHAVRDVAPGKVVFCVSFTATAKLLRFMQGDFQ